MRFLSCALSLLVLAFSQSGRAADGSSGCGPAWYVFKENSILSSSLRLVTNGVLFPFVTLGMTFGTSNCSKHKLVMDDKSSLHFATQSYDLLRQDIAKGHGQHLNAYIATLNCAAAAHPQLAEGLQASYHRELFLTVAPEAIVESTAALIQASPDLTQACS